MPLRNKLYIFILFFICAQIQPVPAVEGLILYTRAPSGSGYTYEGDLLLSQMVSGNELGADLLIDTDVLSAQFSPDCQHIAYVRLRNGMEEIVVADRTGTNKQVIKDSISHPGDIRWCVYLCWRLPDKIIYSYDRSTDVFAIHPVTGEESVFYTAQVGFSKVSIDTAGLRMTVRARTGYNGVYNIDVASGVERQIAGGCSNWISPNGLLMTHCTGGWNDYVIRRWNGDIYKSYSLQDYTHLHHWSHNSNEWIIYQRSLDTKLNTWCNLWIQNIETGENIQLTTGQKYNDTGRDFWVGSVGSSGQVDSTPPSVPQNLAVVDSTGSMIEVTWNASTDAQSAVLYYNVYLGDSIAARSPDTIAAVEGLQRSTTYTISVGAVNASNYESARSASLSAATTDETLPSGTIFIAAEEGLPANGMSNHSDAGALTGEAIFGTTGSASAPQNTDSKSTYTISLERTATWHAWGRFSFSDGQANSYWIAVNGGAAQRFGNGEHNLTNWHWEGYMQEGGVSLGRLDEGDHTLEIYTREPAGDNLLDVICLTPTANYTPADNDVVIGVTPGAYVQVVSPNGDEQYSVGDAITITWQADQSKISMVDIFISPDEGTTWKIVNADSSIKRSSPLWGNYTWVIPAEIQGVSMSQNMQCFIKIEDYEPQNDAYIDFSDAGFTIGGTSVATNPDGPIGRQAVLLRAGGQLYINPGSHPAEVEILDVHGRTVLGRMVTQRTNLDLKSLPPAAYVARIRNNHRILRKLFVVPD
ncbi:MAG: hypothetical protein GF398_20055 [Chitinivibrionales bacterium]|nr:hypothetical protein [Chitinivibrionales bacterium]